LRLALGSGTRPETPPAGHPVTQIAVPVRSALPGRQPDPEQPDPEQLAQQQLAQQDHEPGAAATQASGKLAPAEAGRGDEAVGDRQSHADRTVAEPGAAATRAWRAGDQRRKWWRSPAPLAGLCAAVLVLAGGGYLLAGRGHSGGSGHSPQTTAASGLALPGCTTATAKAPNLTGVATATTAVGGSPFGVAATPDGQYTFITTGNAVVLLRNDGGLAPAVVRTIPLRGADKGVTLTPDGHFALVAVRSGAAVVNVAAAESGAPDPVTGLLTSRNGSGAVEVLISPDDRFAFVTLQNSAEMAVFNLSRAFAHGLGISGFVGDVPLAAQPVGMTTDGRWLYVVSLTGKLAVLNLSKAETDPAHSVVATVRDGCGSARALLSGNGQVVWVTARQSDALLGFSAARLRTDPSHALVARVMIGETPLGETLVDHGTRILVADSNLNQLAGVPSNLAVVSTAKALSGKPALLGYIPVGAVPRQFAVEPGGRVALVTVQRAGQLVAVNVAGLS
jgi:DNA-binding beta-propeller fold protein YncE